MLEAVRPHSRRRKDCGFVPSYSSFVEIPVGGQPAILFALFLLFSQESVVNGDN